MKKQQKKALEVGIGIAAAGIAAAAAGAYLLTGKQGQKNRKKISSWAVKAKKDIVTELKSAQKVSKQTYNDTVKNVLAKYKQLKNVDPKELQSLMVEAQGHWNNIAAELKAASNTVSKAAKKVTKTPVKKTAKKAPAKKVAKKK